MTATPVSNPGNSVESTCTLNQVITPPTMRAIWPLGVSGFLIIGVWAFVLWSFVVQFFPEKKEDFRRLHRGARHDISRGSSQRVSRGQEVNSESTTAKRLLVQIGA